MYYTTGNISDLDDNAEYEANGPFKYEISYLVM